MSTQEVSFAIVSDPGTTRGKNEDSCGFYEESPVHVLLAVADGVGGEEGGEIASQTAIDVTLQSYRESPQSWGTAKRLYRAVQAANIAIHDRAIVVTELRRMATTLTAIVIDGGTLHAAHVGDSRLYLARGGSLDQKTKDHTVASSRRRMGLISADAAKIHPERSTLTRSLGRELIAAVDRLAFQLADGNAVIVCSDGLYNVLDESQIRAAAVASEPPFACAALIGSANAIGTPDNLTVAIARISGTFPPAPPGGFRGLLTRILGS